MAFALSKNSVKSNLGELLSEAVSRLPVAVSIYDSEFNIVFANQPYLSLWGLTETALRSKKRLDRLTQQQQQLEAGFEPLLSDPLAGTVEPVRARFRDGRLFELSALSFEMAEGELFTLRLWRDQTQSDIDQQALEQHLSLLKNLTDLIPDQLFFKDLSKRYTEVNASFLIHHGLESQDDILGYTDSALLAKADATRSHEEEEYIFETGKPLISELREEVRLNGEHVWNQTTKMPHYDATGAITGLYGFSLDVTDQRRNEQLIWRQANYDHLTQLPNRRLLAERWHAAWQAHLRDGKGIGLILVNLDQFKLINDSLGFQSGEQLLVSVAERLRRCTRGKDSIARLSGDEFAILATDIKSEDDLLVVVRKVLSQFDEPYLLGRHRVTVNTSVGVAIAPQEGGDLDEILMHADQALHEAKRNGGKRFVRFSDELHTNVSKQFSLANDLRYAVKNQEFSINFQPIVDLQNGLEWVKVETLIRWYHQRRGWVSPAEFIPVAEQTGLIVEIGEWVYHEALERLAEVQAATGHQLIASVNVSPLQLKAEGFSPDRWIEKARSLGIEPHNLVVEITEGMFLDPDEKVLEHLGRFSELGVKVSLDDFGTGYASVSFLENFSVDVLKLDRAFVNDSEKTKKRRILAEAIINMARALELDVVAEGIETEAQSDWLREAGCEYGQGYYFSKPLTPGELQAQLLQRLASN